MLIPKKIYIQEENKGKFIEALVYPLLLIFVLWIVFFLDRIFYLDLYRFGVKPYTIEGLKGVLFMPFIHSQKDYSHIINNSIPTFILMATLIYFYKEVALKVILSIWLGTGFMLWYIAVNTGSYHIGISGIIYGLFGFLFLSGFVIHYRPLQAISLFVAFVYGSMIWGVLPTKEAISWEGHLSGLIIGFFLAIVFRKKGPQPPKYKYEIEAEQDEGEEDLEAYWKEPSHESIDDEMTISKQKKEPPFRSSSPEIQVEYHFVEKDKRKES
ncbi:MAG: rhomboid family intramembrane serine protease [Brumimicrobium sp.]|nr:rhomboid family intramembrane serine protease [Brumimicrobium sp.]